MPVIREPSMRCLSCDYDLRGLDRNRCPECGREFNPSDPRTFKSAQSIARRPVGLGVAHVGFVVLLVIVGFFLLVERGRQSNPWLLAAWPFGVGMFSFLIGARAKEMLISVAVLAGLVMILLTSFVQEPPDWPIPLAITAVLAGLLFGGFLVGGLIRRVCRSA